MYPPNLSPSGSSGGSFNPVQFTEIALRSAEQLYNMNVSATRVLLQSQASAATAFGLPDISTLIDAATEQTRQVLSTSTEQILNVAQRASDVASELQRSTSQLIQAQTQHASQVAETIKDSMQELNAQTAESLSQFGESSSLQAMNDGARVADEIIEDVPKPQMPLNPVTEAVQSVLPPGHAGG